MEVNKGDRIQAYNGREWSKERSYNCPWTTGLEKAELEEVVDRRERERATRTRERKREDRQELIID